MITINDALFLNKDDLIFDICGRQLKIKSYTVTYNQSEPTNVIFYCVDINTGALLYFCHNEIYQNYEDLSDEDKLFLSWIRKKEDCYTMCEDELLCLREAYLSGFRDGYITKDRINAERQLQK
jgi:uncharacterized secreted protein with C-terminal beta-propeller domain